jgi:hypothetical protein
MGNNVNKKKRGKVFIVLLSVFLAIALLTSVFIYNLFYRTIPVFTVFLVNDSLSRDGNTLSFKCDTDSSAIALKSYNYYIEDENIYISIKGGLVSQRHQWGRIDITINDDEIRNVTNVFLKSGKETELIHSFESN